MTTSDLARFRWPIAAVLIGIAVILLWPRGGSADPLGADASPSASVVVGELDGDVLSTGPAPQASAASTAGPTVSPDATPTAEPTATATPQTAADGFGAEVLACRSISGDSCNDQLGTLPSNAASFTALVRFSEANAGDEMNATLDGPSGEIGGFPYTLQGGGDGYYYSEFQAGGLSAGDYTLTATRNGEVVATTTFTKGGG
jgi:hypothetical protein